MSTTQPVRFKTIAEYHRYHHLPQPKHPLISLVKFDERPRELEEGQHNFLFEFYSIAVKRSMQMTYKYGQLEADFDDGVMFLMAPNQLFGVEIDKSKKQPVGWMLLVHPDFLWNTALAKTIKQYEFFDYTANEALFLSEDEENKIQQIIKNIEDESNTGIDKFSQGIIIAQLETLLNYTDRFYQRQFITRQKANHQILAQLETLLDAYIASEELMVNGLPSVNYVSENLNVSPNYLRRLLKELTGQNTQQHIHDKIIDKAKEKLSTTTMSVSEIAYALGFEHPQSFSKLFKSKTQTTPMAFRHSFN